MFEKHWKPQFDAWAERTNVLLENVVQSQVYMDVISSVLDNTFRAKRLGDRVSYRILRGLGISNAREQQKILHLVLRNNALSEDLRDEVQELREEVARLRKELEIQKSDTEQENK